MLLYVVKQKHTTVNIVIFTLTFYSFIETIAQAHLFTACAFLHRTPESLG